MRLPRAALIIALTTTMLLVGAPAYADNGAPSIVSLTRTSGEHLTAGDPAEVQVVVSDTGTSTIQYVQLIYVSARGHLFVISKWVGASAGTLTASQALGPWAASGRWTLDRARIYDAAGNSTTYKRDGSIEVRPSGAQPPPATDLDLAAADFDVDNPNQDVTAPSIEQARVVFDRVLAGTPAVAMYSVSDDRSGIENVSIQYFLPGRAVMFLSGPPGELAQIGPASGLIPLFTEAGEAKLAHVAVRDKAGNTTLVTPDRVMTVPSGANQPAHADVDPDELAFTVEPVAPDADFPSVDGLTMRSPPRIPPASQVSVDFAVTDQTTSANYVDLVWRDEAGHSMIASQSCVVLDSGRLILTVPSYWEDGTQWQLMYARVNDRARHGTVYYRDGTIGHTAGNVTTPTDLRHDLDLTQGDFVIDSSAERPVASPVRSLCDRPTIVDLIADPPQIAQGESSRIRGEVDAGGLSVEHPVAAVYEYRGLGPRLAGVVRGNDEGLFGLRVSPGTDRTYRARFLGSDGTNPAAASMSDPIAIRIVPEPDVWARASRTTLARGEYVRFRAGATRVRAGESIYLMRRTRDGWRRVAVTALSEDLIARFRIQPPAGRHTYAVMLPAQGSHAAGRSPAIELRVH